MVSRSHAVIEWGDAVPRRFTLTDLVSSNGTFVNGERVSGMVVLQDGDQIQLGGGGPVVRFAIDSAVDAKAGREITQSIPKISVNEATESAVAETIRRPLPGHGGSG